MTVLRTVLVDDVADMRHLVRALLSRDGRFDVVGEAADGAQAIDVVADLHPDLVVLDVGMPVLDGIATLPRLRDISPRTRVVVLSGHPAEEMARPALQGGAVGYLEKSADIAKLPAQLHAMASVLETVQQVLDRTYDKDLTSARAARRDLREALQAKLADGSLERVELLTSELVSNAVEHAGSPARVTATLTGRSIRVGVSDDGPGIPRTPTQPSAHHGGRGLTIVDQVATGWGVETHDVGKTVWFELEL